MFNKPIVRSVVVLLLLLIAIGIFVFTDFGKNRTVIYDCRMSEISPDFPVEVKEECRKLRLEHFQQKQKRNFI
jgi:hypothetical protein